MSDHLDDTKHAGKEGETAADALLSESTRIVALDAETGKEIWVHEGLSGITSKGINYWQSADGKDRRLIFAVDSFLQEIDARTGKSIMSFGDNGIIGVVMANDKGAGEWELDNFLLSCRVIGRTVETAILATIIENARAAGARKIGGWFIPTKKNAPARDFYSQHRFTKVLEDGGKQRWEMDLTRTTVEAPPWVNRLMTSEASA